MNKKAENGGIGVIGVIFAILIVLSIRGCSLDNHQSSINSFCENQSFDYGVESIRSTVILCETWDGNETKSFRYSDFNQFELQLSQERIARIQNKTTGD